MATKKIPFYRLTNKVSKMSLGAAKRVYYL